VLTARPPVDPTFQVIVRINQRLWPIPTNKQQARIWLNFRNDWRAARFLRANELLLTRSFRQQLSHKRGRPLRFAVVIIRASRYTGYTYLVRVSFLIEPFVRKWFYTYVHRQVFSRPRDRHGETKRRTSARFFFPSRSCKRNKREGMEIRDGRMEVDTTVCWSSLWPVQYLLPFPFIF